MDSSRDDSRVESYLAAVDLSMGKVPAERREALLLELRGHVDKLVEDYEADGKSKVDSVDQALSMMGASKKLGRQYARMWYRSTEPGNILAALGVMTVAGSVASAVLNPLYSHLNAQFPAGMAPSAALLVWAIARMSSGLFAGWYASKGAVRAAWIESILAVVSSTVMLLTLPHAVMLNVKAQYVDLALSNVLGVGGAVIAVRLRMRKFAGI